MTKEDKHFHDFVEDRFRGKILVKDYGDREYGKFVEIIDNGDNGSLIRIATIDWGSLSERLLQLRDVEKQYTPYTRKEFEAEIKEDLDRLESSTLGELTKEKAKGLTDDEGYIFY